MFMSGKINSNISRRILRSVLAIRLVVAIWACLLPAAEAAPPDPMIPQLTADLESDDYETRESATRRLSLLGRPAIPAVERAIEEGSLESTARGLSILEQGLLKGDPETIQAALEAVERLQIGKHPEIRHRVETLMANHRPQVEAAILRYFESLGGKVQRQQSNSPFQRGFPFPAAQTSQLILVIGADFKGTQADLVKLRNVRVSTILHRKAVTIEDATRQTLLQWNPNLKFIERDIYLGISYEVGENRLIVTQVQPQSSAAEAGFTIGDEILSVDGIPVVASEDLINLLQSHDSGDKLKFQMQRKGKPVELEVTVRGL